MLDWNELRFFLAVCRDGSFAAAARKLKVDETTVARRIARLEASLGARLFGRTPDGLAPTPAGESVRASAEEMERSAIELTRRAMGADGKLAGRVRIAAPELLGIHFVLPALLPLRQKHPDIVIEFLPGMARLDIARAEADIGIRTIRPAEADLVCRRIGGLAMAGYVRKGGPLDAVVSFSDAFRPPIRSAQEFLPQAKVALRTNSTGAVLQAVRLGMGVGDVPCFIGDADPALSRAFPQAAPEAMELYLVAHADVHRTGRVRTVLRALAEAFEKSSKSLMGKVKR
ncbi:MAG TPA: LysR family transcriptional regulator [Myxococcales bacterium]|jgi:DNA-binding transcriptional LysR family regulator|nr:LysR family transcriptional regulator [Myxococcales bacterium]